MSDRFSAFSATDVGRQFQEALFWSCIENYVISEMIDVTQYTDGELLRYCIGLAVGANREGAETDAAPDGFSSEVRPAEVKTPSVSFTATHESDLAEEADSFLRRGKHELATLLYATWVEHWINRIILKRSIGVGTPKELATALVRSSRLELKIGRIWTSIGLPRFDKDLARGITRMMESRNGFVHYKWPEHDDDAFFGEEREADRNAEEAKRVVEQLAALEDSIFFNGRKESIMQYIHEVCLARQWRARRSVDDLEG